MEDNMPLHNTRIPLLYFILFFVPSPPVESLYFKHEIPEAGEVSAINLENRNSLEVYIQASGISFSPWVFPKGDWRFILCGEIKSERQAQGYQNHGRETENEALG